MKPQRAEGFSVFSKSRKLSRLTAGSLQPLLLDGLRGYV